jgi:1,2-phenylacetyl-CoA epoxidase PaaB subunit
MTRRYIRQNADGAWEVLPEGHRRSLVHADTKEKAVRRARDVVRREGGGEIRVMDDVGKIASTLIVKAPAARTRRR